MMKKNKINKFNKNQDSFFMTTIAYHQYCNIPYIGGSNTSYPIRPKCAANTLYGKPLYHIKPCAMVKHNDGILSTRYSNPPQFQSFNSSSSFAQMRSQYRHSGGALSTGTTTAITPVPQSKKKTFTQMPYSMYLAQQRSNSVGKSSLKQTDTPLTYKSFDRNVTKQALHRLRNSSCVAPAKKSAIKAYYYPPPPPPPTVNIF
jgi:hypothetical protein